MYKGSTLTLFDGLVHVTQLYELIKKKSIILENSEQRGNADQERDRAVSEYNHELKSLEHKLNYVGLPYMTDALLTKFRKVVGEKTSHPFPLENFTKYTDELQLRAGTYYISPKLDGISLLAWKQNQHVSFVTRGNGEEGQDKTEFMEMFFPQIVKKVQRVFHKLQNAIGIRGELILDKKIKNYPKYLRILNKSKREQKEILPDHVYTESVSRPPSLLKAGTIYQETRQSEKPMTPLPNYGLYECFDEYCTHRADKMMDPFHTEKFFRLSQSIKSIAIYLEDTEINVIQVKHSGYYPLIQTPGTYTITLYYVDKKKESFELIATDPCNLYLELNLEPQLRRELVAGLANKRDFLTEYDEYKDTIHWMCYHIYGKNNQPPCEIDEASAILKNAGLNTVYTLKKHTSATFVVDKEFIVRYNNKPAVAKYDNDGMIIKYNMNFKDILCVKSSRLAETTILKMSWNKNASGSLRPKAEISPLYHNDKSYKSVNLFNFENVCEHVFEEGDRIEVKFIADSLIVVRNLTIKKKTPDKLRKEILNEAGEKFWVDGPNLMYHTNPIFWFVQKLKISKIREATLRNFLAYYEIEDSLSILHVIEVLMKLKQSTMKLRSHQYIVNNILHAILQTDDFALALYSIQIPGARVDTMKKIFAESIDLDIDVNTGKIRHHTIKPTNTFDKNKTTRQFRDSITAFIRHYEFFLNTKRTLSHIKDDS